MDGDATRNDFQTELFVDGAFLEGRGETRRVTSPLSEGTIIEFAGASRDQVDEAVRSAKNAFESGVRDDPSYRRTILLRFADLIEENGDLLMETSITEIGSPVNLKANHTKTPVTFLR